MKKDLSKWMEQNRFTPTTLAKALGFKSSSTIWEWQTKGRKPRQETIKKFTKLIKQVDNKPFKASLFFEEP